MVRFSKRLLLFIFLSRYFSPNSQLIIELALKAIKKRETEKILDLNRYNFNKNLNHMHHNDETNKRKQYLFYNYHM